ncbi:low affinity immunoglobulin epsilon Fc receptor-like [Saccostrea cucullata]|uniref:low affinity immunoglobulin epsilon Fc receptor-like n=1 Tax=Saccostrea cuccullata TaxID=36930 RepID=UPI002ECFB01D
MKEAKFIIFFSISLIFGYVLSKVNDQNENELLRSPTSGKTSQILQEILKQESYLRFSIVQKIQNLVMNAIDNNNITKRLTEKLDSLGNKVTSIQSIQSENRKLEDTLDEALDDFQEGQNATTVQLQRIPSLHHSTCEHDWIQLANSCYLFSSESANFSDAMVSYKCNKMVFQCKIRCNILEIRTPEEEKWIDFYLKIKGIRNIWIGLTVVVKENEFVYESDGQKPNYTNWRIGEPNNVKGSEHCTEKERSSGWNDINCNRKFRFLCKTD